MAVVLPNGEPVRMREVSRRELPGGVFEVEYQLLNCTSREYDLACLLAATRTRPPEYGYSVKFTHAMA